MAELIGILRPERIARVEPHDDFLRVISVVEHDRPALAAGNDERFEFVFRKVLPELLRGGITNRADVGFAGVEVARVDAIERDVALLRG
jgi:hypothetical protein